MSKFNPIARPIEKPGLKTSGPSITATVNLKGEVGEEFEKMVLENNLNRSALLKQMVLHCLGYEEELKRLRNAFCM